MIGPGSRVQYKFLHKDTGTVIRRTRRGKGDKWLVQWDHDPHGPRILQAYEENLIELLIPDGTSQPSLPRKNDALGDK